METKTNSTHKSEVKLTNDTFILIKNEIKNKLSTTDWELSGNIDDLPTIMLETVNSINSFSKKKKLKSRIHFLLTRGVTLKRIQNLFNVFNVDSIKISKSLKEQEIQKFRAIYVEKRNESLKIYNDYKKVKGDYYKNS